MQNEHELARSDDDGFNELAQSDNGGPMEISVSDYLYSFWAQPLPNELDDTLSSVNSVEDDDTLNDLTAPAITPEETRSPPTRSTRARQNSTDPEEESDDSPPTDRKKLRAALTGSQGRGNF